MQTPSDASTMDISPRVISELPILTVCVPCAGKNLEKHSRFGAKLNLIPSNLSPKREWDPKRVTLEKYTPRDSCLGELVRWMLHILGTGDA